LATPNYSFEKRQRELAKKRKKEEKNQRKLAKSTAHDAESPEEPAPVGEASERP
jgi:hypothetical protein